MKLTRVSDNEIETFTISKTALCFIDSRGNQWWEEIFGAFIVPRELIQACLAIIALSILHSKSKSALAICEIWASRYDATPDELAGLSGLYSILIDQRDAKL